MRKKLSLLFCATALVAGICSVAQADTMPAGLRARYVYLVKALERLDLKAYEAIYAPEYVSVDTSGKTSDRATYMAGIQDMMKGVKKATFKLTFTGVKVHDGITDVSFDVRGKLVSPAGTTTFHEVGVDSWKKVGKVWMEIKTVDKTFDVVAPKPKPKK
jgi:hypothetical protein